MHHLAHIGVLRLHREDSSDKKLHNIKAKQPYQAFRIGGNIRHETGSPTRVSVASEAIHFVASHSIRRFSFSSAAAEWANDTLSMYLFQLDLPHLGLTLLVHFFTTEIFANYKPTTLRTKKLHKLVLERRSWPLQILPPPLPNGNLPGTAYYFIPDSIFSYPTLIHCHLYSCFTHYLSNRRRNSCFASEADLGQHRRLETCRKSGKEKKKHQGYDWICQTMYALTVILKSTVIS